jgi:hypothetical protein
MWSSSGEGGFRKVDFGRRIAEGGLRKVEGVRCYNINHGVARSCTEEITEDMKKKEHEDPPTDRGGL